MELEIDDDIPLAFYVQKSKESHPPRQLSQPIDNQTCEIAGCTTEVFSSCHRCFALQCYEHFLEEVATCAEHGQSSCFLEESEDSSPTSISSLFLNTMGSSEIPSKKSNHNTAPENYIVDGNRREFSTRQKQVNRKKLASKLRIEGKEYISYYTNKKVPARKMLENNKCNAAQCRKISKWCDEFSKQEKEDIFKGYWSLTSIQLRREFITRYCSQIQTKQKTTKKKNSRTSKTILYSLPLKGISKKVCKNFFLSTLGISEKTVFTCMKKLKQTGIVEEDKRGGRSKYQLNRDNKIKNDINEHINRFPREESHYCRSSSNREYLHGDLSLSKMYEMYQDEFHGQTLGSFSTYRRIFETMKLSFNKPKKDQCSLCLNYRKGDLEIRQTLEERYRKHVEKSKGQGN